MNEYDKQAADFLESTGTKFKIEYLYTGTYFPDDTEKRDIYQFTLTTARGSYSSKFGDSIHNTERRAFAQNGWNEHNLSRNMEAKRLGIKTLSEFKTWRNYKPSPYDILACMDTYTPETFKEFCEEYGYDDRPLSEHDSVRNTFLAVREQSEGLRRIYSPEQLNLLAEIQ